MHQSFAFQTVRYSIEVLTVLSRSVHNLTSTLQEDKNQPDQACIRGLSTQMKRFVEAMWNNRRLLSRGVEARIDPERPLVGFAATSLHILTITIKFHAMF